MGSGSRSKPKKKRSQKHSKKKTRSITKDRTKKRKRRNDSVSSSDEDSMTDSSVSCHSSDGDYKSKKRARSRDRRDRKDRKKRAKRARSVSETSEDDSPRVKKHKRSKMSKDLVSRKKRHGKKRKRSHSVSPLSERSRSPPSREISDDSERDFARNQGKERKRKEKSKRREKGKERSGSKSKSRHKSRSCSPRSLRSESDNYGSENEVLEESNRKRLKSVIVVPHDREEAEIREPNCDGNKAELIFEHDDYPRSNDSNDGVSGKEASSLLHDVNSVKRSALDDSNLETAPSDIQTSEIPESQIVIGEKTEGVISNKFSLGGNDQLSTETGGSNCDDLAAVLRQKALENFLKRQGKLLRKKSIDKKGDTTNELNSSSSLMTHQAEHSSDVHSPLKSVSKLGKADDVSYATEVTKGKDTSLPKRVSGITRSAELYTAPSGFADGRTKSGLSIPRKEFLGAKNTWRRQVVSQEPSSTSCGDTIGKDFKQKVSVPVGRTDHGSSRGCIDSTVTSGKVEGDVASQPSSIVQNSSDEKTNEVDGGDSQFQQKTMSVMRGGEMVQVSYKVYIPNKVPALARRQLKR